MRDWKHDAEQYRDLDREAQARAEKELGAVMDGLAESVADLPDAEVLAEAREADEDTAAVAARVQTVIRRAAGAMADPTPGPWESPGTDDGARVVTFHDRHGKRRTLAHVYYGRTDDERDANARLIALAPRMVELARLIVRWEREIGDRMNCHVAEVRREARAILRELDGRRP